MNDPHLTPLEDFFPQTVTFMCLCNSLSSPHLPFKTSLLKTFPSHQHAIERVTEDLHSFNPFSAFRTLYDVRRDLTGSANSPTRTGLISLILMAKSGSMIKSAP